MRIESFKISGEFDVSRNDDNGILLEFYFEFRLKLRGVDGEVFGTLTSDLNYEWQNNEILTEEENSLMHRWVENNMELILDENYRKFENYFSNYSYQIKSYEETIETENEDIFKNDDKDDNKNVELKEGFTQVCIWPGTTFGDSTSEKFEKDFKDGLGTRIQFLEIIETKPDVDSNGQNVPDTGGRSDIFFAVHNEDISKFAIKKLTLGIRWIEDVLSNTNGYQNNPIYPNRVHDYKSW